MSGTVNKAIVLGYLGKDPEERKTRQGNPVVSFSVATSERWRDKTTGERKEHSDWHNIVIFVPHLCEVAMKYLKKGSKVYLEGEMKTRSWDDEKTGVKRYMMEVVLKGFNAQLQLMDSSGGGKRDEEEYGRTFERGGDDEERTRVVHEREPQKPIRGGGPNLDDPDDEIPF